MAAEEEVTEPKKPEKEKEEPKAERRRAPRRSAKTAVKQSAPPEGEAQITTEEMIRRYLNVYERCMLDDPKSFDAKGALGALDQIVKVLGLEAAKPAGEEHERLRIVLEGKVDGNAG